MTGVDDTEQTIGRSPAGGVPRPLRPYADIFRTPGAWRFSAAGVIGRMPMSMFGLGTVLLISAATGKYGVAGTVAAVGSLGYAFSSPQVARLVDSRGQRRVLPGPPHETGESTAPPRPGCSCWLRCTSCWARCSCQST